MAPNDNNFPTITFGPDLAVGGVCLNKMRDEIAEIFRIPESFLLPRNRLTIMELITDSNVD